MGTIAGRDCKVEVALTFKAAVTGGATAITLADPPVVTDAGHGLTVGEVGFWLVTGGMVELNEQAFFVGAPDTNTFTMPGFETSNYSAFVGAESTYTMADTWGVVAEAAAYGIGGGAAAELDDTRLIDVKTRTISGNLAAQNVTIDVRNQEVDGAAMAFVAKKARATQSVLMRIRKGTKTLRVFYGVPSLPGESTAAGALASGQFSVLCPGWVVKPNV
jgi:hypothetical protein